MFQPYVGEWVLSLPALERFALQDPESLGADQVAVARTTHTEVKGLLAKRGQEIHPLGGQCGGSTDQTVATVTAL
jgi:hypothetical protein